jgi:hypothetical protein
MRTHFYFCLFLGWAVPVFSSSAQSEITISAWGETHGIESTIIYGVFQDANHLIRICTYNGLYYFDGFRAYKATILDADNKMPYEGFVTQLLQTSNGNYWLKLENRAVSYDIYSQQFTPYILQCEVGREGVMIRKSYQRTRWYNGEVFTWIGYHKTVGRG